MRISGAFTQYSQTAQTVQNSQSIWADMTDNSLLGRTVSTQLMISANITPPPPPRNEIDSWLTWPGNIFLPLFSRQKNTPKFNSGYFSEQFPYKGMLFGNQFDIHSNNSSDSESRPTVNVITTKIKDFQCLIPFQIICIYFSFSRYWTISNCQDQEL